MGRILTVLLATAVLGSLMSPMPSAVASPLARSGIRVSELHFACHTGDPAFQFLELTAVEDGQECSSRLAIEVRDRNDRIVFTMDSVFTRPSRGLLQEQPLEIDSLYTPLADGTPWSRGRSWLLGSFLVSWAGFGDPDRMTALRLDPVGGRVTLVDRTDDSIVHDVAWGTRGSIAAVTPGHSIGLRSDGTMGPVPTSPTTWDGGTSTTVACFGCGCGGSTYGGGGPGQRAESGYDEAAGRLWIDLRSGGSQPGLVGASRSTGHYAWIEGVPAGTPVEFDAALDLEARGRNRDGAGELRVLRRVGDQEFEIRRGDARWDIADRFAAPASVVAYEPFELNLRIEGELTRGSLDASVRLSVAALPAGAVLKWGGRTVSVDPPLARALELPSGRDPGAPPSGGLSVRRSVGAVFAFDVGVAGSSPARLEIVDVGGRRIDRVTIEPLAGTHTVSMNEPTSPGMYFVRLEQAGRRATTRVVVLQ